MNVVARRLMAVAGIVGLLVMGISTACAQAPAVDRKAEADAAFSLNLVTSLKSIERDKPVAHGLLAALDFNEGKRYGDFNKSIDKVAEYGLAALVAGVAAKKLGLLAMAGVFFVKFWKIALIGIVGVGALIAKITGSKKS